MTNECEEQTQLYAPLKWHGGKSYLADWIISHLPPHVHYVELFAGGLAVLLGKDPEGISEVVNDLDGDLTNFWAVLKDADSFEEFKRRVEATPVSSIEFGAAKAFNSGDDAVERAISFFVLCRQSRQGLQTWYERAGVLLADCHRRAPTNL